MSYSALSLVFFLIAYNLGVWNGSRHVKHTVTLVIKQEEKP